MATPDAHPKLVIVKGSAVEVSSDEEGFKGAWYRATVVEPPSKSKRKKVLVEYETLVKDDGQTPLTEPVDQAYIRPLPPEGEETTDGETGFEEDDVVDARYRDGWWTGVVRKVLEDSGMYRVYFDNPPDVIDFNGKDLRMHLDWVEGRWIRPEKQQSTKSMFSSGTDVEVKVEKDNLGDIWFPALVIKEIEDGTFYVKYPSSRNRDDTESVKLIVDSRHIRPSLPCFPQRDYDLLECVDTVYESGWRDGTITKLLAGRRYTVFFKQANEDKEFDHSDIRPHVEWEDGQWQTKFKEPVILPIHQKRLGHASNSTDNSDVVGQAARTPLAIQYKTDEKPYSARTRKKWMDRSTPCNESYALSPVKKIKLTASNGGPKHSSLFKKLSEGNAAEAQVATRSDRLKRTPNVKSIAQPRRGFATPGEKGSMNKRSTRSVINEQPSAKSEISLRAMAAKRKQQIAGESENKTADAGTNGSPAIKSPRSSVAEKKFDSPIVLCLKANMEKESQGRLASEVPTEEIPKLKQEEKKFQNDSVGDKKKEAKQRKSGGSSQKRKRGRPRKFIRPELPQAVRQDASDPRATRLSDSDYKTKKVDKGVAEAPNNLSEDDQPLSTWIGGNISSNAEELRLSSVRTSSGANDVAEKQIDICVESSGNVSGGNDVTEKQIDICVESPGKSEVQALPFMKVSPIWKTIESMEVFRIVPQKPHFRPLLETKEEYREGSAIGIMVTFATLFEKIAGLQFDDPRSIFDSLIESLLDLEKHGLDVTAPQGRINELLAIKDRQEQLLTESKDAGRDITKHNDEKRKLDEELEEIQRQIAGLQKQHAAIKFRRESKDAETERLLLHAKSLNERIQNSRHEFQKVLSAPWKLP